MALSDLGVTDGEAQYILGSVLHSYILEIFVYALYTVVSFVACYLTLSRGSGKPRRHSAILITIIWVVLTIHTALRWSYIDFVFVQNGSSRETELIAYSLTMLPRDVTSFITLFLSILLADATMIWRCWMLYGRRWTVIVLPVLSLAGGTVAHISRGVAAFGRHGLEADSVEPKWQIVFLSTTVFTNVFCTVSIIFRVVSISGWSKSLKTYHGLLEILIESAIMYTSIYIIQIALYIHGAYFQDEWDTRFFYAQALANIITGVAPTLIIARVALGHARPDDSWTRTSLPHLRTTMRSVAESMRFARHDTGTATEVDLERNENSQASWEVERIQASSNTRIEPKEKPQLVV